MLDSGCCFGCSYWRLKQMAWICGLPYVGYGYVLSSGGEEGLCVGRLEGCGSKNLKWPARGESKREWLWVYGRRCDWRVGRLRGAGFVLMRGRWGGVCGLLEMMGERNCERRLEAGGKKNVWWPSVCGDGEERC
ncbi:hypothetical protein NC653_004587 [Populus alba x Populus x berolinensis]|uniref:Uncharacterized protein n=2 Tax=Populus TaxID=3689 RepID=A0A4U5P4Q7_POPAL|nr:hypothetical protein NC653_004587 [Populus alba x Populus x berolinensis]TKR91242.1 hypothetical protein D5086_0000225040 [Populus alba]